MPIQMDWLGWIIVGLFAGALSGAVVPGHTARGCLPNILVGILGGFLGGVITRELGFGRIYGFVAAVIVAFVGAVIVRYLLEALGDRR
jgi:uncharacterized membrane protein YeaQ/YmgE (transglycosylase-associated protein family)